MKYTLRFSLLLAVLTMILGWTMTTRGETPSPQAETETEEGAGPSAAPQSAGRDADVTLRVLHGGKVETMDMGTYLIGVLRAEMPASFEPEALKAQAVAARTYTLYRMRQGPSPNHPDADACDDISCCKAYKTAEDAAAQWGGMAVYYEEKLLRAVAETDAQTVQYGGEPILAVFCSSTNGHTQPSGAVWQTDLPYLQSVESPETEASVPNYYSTARFSPDEFRGLFCAAYPHAELRGGAGGWITDVVRADTGFVTSLTVGGVKVKGNDLRTVLSLRSPCFTVSAEDDALTFFVTGYGHGVGMSQYGANELARQGASYVEILEHYFTGTTVAKNETV